MAILVTGAAGFIGSHVAKELLDRNQDVVLIDNFDDYYNISLKKYRVEKFGLKVLNVDIRDLNSLSKVFAENKIDKVIHLAARPGVRGSILNPLLYAEINIKGTMNMLECSKKVKNFVFASSSSVYGDSAKVPFNEDDNITDKPASPYAATKKSGEVLCHCYHHLYGTPVTVLRFFTVYGPMGRPDMAVYKFTERIMKGQEIEQYGDGSTERDYTFITDIVDGVISSLENAHDYEIINLGNNKPCKLSKLIGLIEKETGKKAKIRIMNEQLGDVKMTCADITKAQKLLHYKPKVRIEEGVHEFVEWYKGFANDSKKTS